MKIAYSEYNIVIDTDNEATEIIIENQGMMGSLVNSIIEHIDGKENSILISEDGKTLQPSKVVEMVSSFIPFEINKKTLVTRLVSKMVENSTNEINHEKTLNVMQLVETYLYDICEDLGGSITFSKCNIENVIKGASPCFENEHDSLGEELLDYFELVREYENEKLFVLYNLRTIMTDEELSLFIETSNMKKYQLILIESTERCQINGLRRYIMDMDCCWIS